SNMGVGPWEVNLQYVLSKQNGGEWPNLFVGRTVANNRIMLGKYGQNNPNQFGVNYPVPVPANGGPLVGTSGVPHFYGLVDYDAIITYPTTRAPTTAISLPGQGTQPAFTCFPGYPLGYDNNAATSKEGQDHPALYNVFKPPATTNPNLPNPPWI